MNTRHKQRLDDVAPPSEPVILTTVDLMSSVILSMSGTFEASAEERKLLCLLSDGRLLIASGQALNAHVQSYRARLERLKHAFTIVFCAIEVIGPLYRRGGDNTGRQQEHTVMQVNAKDLLSRGCRERASDIHIRVNKLGTDFYFRIYNDLIKIGSQTRDYGERLLATIYGAMTAVSDNSYKPTERQDASIGDRDKLPDMLYGVRIATTPTSEGNLMVLRLLYNDAGDHIDLRPLGFSEWHASQIQLLKDQPIGINIISGPTGSGKSTTLQRVLSGELLESQGKMHVITVEDPVEYPIPGAVQTAVTNATTEVERSRLFSAAISNAMRLDPDTIMIGEIRDGASAQSALRAAMTGHQVWSTVHANSAIAIIDRLVDLGLPLAMTADHTIITGLISQRLVKLLCPHCRRRLATCEGELSIAQTERLHRAVGNNLAKVYLTGDGCKACGGKGTIGRTVVAEVILPDAELCTYLRKGDKMGATDYWRTMLGGQTLVEHAISKIADGLIDPSMAEKTVGHLVPLNQRAKPAASPKKA